MYWCDAGLNRIETSDLSGGNRQILVTIERTDDGEELDIHPYDIGIYKNNLYWSDWALIKIVKVDKYGRGAETVGSNVFARAGGLHIFIGI